MHYTYIIMCAMLSEPLHVLQEEYYVTHQFFLTNRALYLLVWNVLDGEAGIQSLSIWLQNLQVGQDRMLPSMAMDGTFVQ